MATIDLDVVGQLVEATRRRQAIIDLQRELLGRAPIPEVAEITADDFYEHYFDANRPLVVRGFANGWPALGKWTPEWFGSAHRDVAIEVCNGRDGGAEPDRNYQEHLATTTMGEFIAELGTAGPTNDLYAISNNKLMEVPEFAALFDDVQPDEAMFPAAQRVPGSVALWIGPAGTITPLHHDTTNVMFCQIYGSKRISLVAPMETAVADGAADFYAAFDVGTPEWFATCPDVVVRTVDVCPGDALFIPVGWWHRVASLEASISFVLLGFAKPNDFTWYRPGSVTA